MNRLFIRFSLLLLLAVLLVLNSGCSKERKIQRYISSGDKDYAAEKYQRAEIEYLSAIRLGSTNSAAMGGLGMVYFQQGRYPQAYGALSRAVGSDPKSKEFRIKLGIICRSMGQVDEARKHALEVLRNEPAHGEALMLLVDSSITPPELQECLKRIEAIPADRKQSLAVLLARGSIKFRTNDLAGAESDFVKAASLDPASERPLTALASVHLARKHFAEAEATLEKAAALAPMRSPARIHYAKALLSAGKVQEARRVVLEVTEKASDYIPAWTFLAEVAFRERKQEDCEGYLRKVLDQDPVNYDGLTLKAKLLIAKGEPAEAVKQFEWIIQSYGTNAEHFYNLAVAQVKSRQENQAIVTLDRALSSDANHVESILLQSTLLLRQGSFGRVTANLKALILRGGKLSQQDQARLPHAFALLARAQAGLRNISEAVATYDAMQKSFPGLIEVHLEAGNGFASFNRTNEAKRAYLQYANLSTNSLGLLLASSGLARLNDLEAARKTLEKIQKSDPAFPPILEAMVKLDLREGHFDNAFARVNDEIKRSGERGIPLLLLANIHMERASRITSKAEGSEVPPKDYILLPAAQPDVKAAETALLKANQTDPTLTPAYYMLAKIWQAQNKHREALAKLSDLTSKTNDLPAFLQVALVHSQVGDYKSAAATYEKVLQFAPDSIEALNNLAGIYSVHLPKLDRAYELAEKARRAAPNAPAVADTLGWVLHKRGQYVQALALLEDAAKALPDEPEVDYHLGMTYYMLGQEEAAKASLERVVSSKKDFPGKAEAPGSLAVLAVDPQRADAAAVAMLEKRAESNSGDAVALARLATVFERKGAFEQAAKTYQLILKNTPGNAQAAFKLAGLCAEHLNQLDKAFDYAKQARSNAPEDPYIAHLFGRVSWLKGNRPYGATLLEESFRKLPNDPAVAHDLAWAYYSLGRIADAKGRMEIAAGAQGFGKQNESKQFLRLLAAGNSPVDASRATPEAEAVLKSDQENVPAMFVLAIASEEAKQYEKAVQLYEKVLTTFPAFSPAMRNLSILVFQNLHQEQRAYELASKARQAFPSDPMLLRTLGILSQKRGENARAVQYLRDLTTTRSDDSELFFYMGMANLGLKNTVEARKSLERAVALKLPEPLAAQAAQALAELNKA